MSTFRRIQSEGRTLTTTSSSVPANKSAPDLTNQSELTLKVLEIESQMIPLHEKSIEFRFQLGHEDSNEDDVEDDLADDVADEPGYIKLIKLTKSWLIESPVLVFLAVGIAMILSSNDTPK